MARRKPSTQSMAGLTRSPASGPAQVLPETPSSAIRVDAGDESRRLDALRFTHLLDSTPEPSFDRLTALACRFLGTPVSLISLVDAQRQFFKSSQGLAEPWDGCRETPLSHSFCQQVVAQDAPLVISDARQHPLVCENLAIREMGVSAYLGVPLHTPDGEAIGALCVIDHVPRTWTDQDLDVLTQLAEPTMMAIAARWHLEQRKQVERELQQTQAALEQQVMERAAELSLSEQRYPDLVEGSVQGIFIHRDGKPLFANQALADMHGYASPDDILQLDSRLDLIAPDEHENRQQRTKASERGQLVPRYRKIHGLRKDGTIFWMEYVAAIVQWEGAPANMVTVMDITARKQAEEKLRESEERFRDLIEESVQGILIHHQGKPVFVNQAFAEIYGYDSLIDIYRLRSFFDLVAPHDRERLKQYRNDHIAGKSAPVHYEFEGVKCDGTLIWLEAVARKIMWDGAPAVQLTLIDKTVSKEADEALQRTDRLAILGRLAATFSHEVRNPLQSLRLYAEILAEEVVACIPDSRSESRQHIDYALMVIQEEATRMSDIVQDYLSLARLSTIAREPENLGAFITGIVRDQRDALRRHGLTLQLDGIDDLGYASIHPSTLRRAILNLLQNAMEAMGSGGCLTLRGGQTDEGLQFDIIDTGPGISPDVLSELFTPFYTTKAEGTGLGLYVVQEIIAAHDGQVVVDSELGHGSTFTIMLPQITPD